MQKKTQKDLAHDFIKRIETMTGEEFRSMLAAEMGPELVLFLAEYADVIAAKWAPGLGKEACTLLSLGYLIRTHEEKWKTDTKPPVA